jgi:hypothetical protein
MTENWRNGMGCIEQDDDRIEFRMRFYGNLICARPRPMYVWVWDQDGYWILVPYTEPCSRSKRTTPTRR